MRGAVEKRADTSESDEECERNNENDAATKKESKALTTHLHRALRGAE